MGTARVRAGTWGCRREARVWRRGSGRSAVDLLPPPQPPPQRRGHVVWCVGRGGGGGGSKAERGDGRETPHTHGTRWPERQQHPELSGVLTRWQSPLVGVELRPSGPQARGGKAAPAETGSVVCWGPISRQGRPERPGPRLGKRRCGIVRRGSPKPRRLGPARARGPAREACAGDLQVPAAALRPGSSTGELFNLFPPILKTAAVLTDEKVTYKIKIKFG
ncbi:uncharacterized protein LOC118992088 [Sturnira hondurensis]|uniref:uncharacterized protein LOC118992088 n=1 Tax=Sturnira hondurensis TaxID=192404 RepID=UPI001879FFBF|nr:uncharacterized protein LOC118992088 [Sturnira hondurensis]